MDQGVRIEKKMCPRNKSKHAKQASGIDSIGCSASAAGSRTWLAMSRATPHQLIRLVPAMSPHPNPNFR